MTMGRVRAGKCLPAREHIRATLPYPLATYPRVQTLARIRA
jgi:hypothetical protein